MPKSLPIALALALAAAATAAQAHVTLETGEAPVGSTYKAVLRVPHGCDGEATLKLRVQAPRGRDRGQADAQARLEARDRQRQLRAAATTTTARQLTEGVTEIAWTGELPDAFYDEFVFRGSLTDDLAPGSALYFPVVQECASAKTERWIEIPAAGQDREALETPAPGLKLLPAAGGD